MLRSVPIDDLYKSELEYALSMRLRERHEYWTAYRHGLRRGYEGAVAVSDAEHISLMRNNHLDTAAGYKAGLLYAESLRTGRAIILRKER